MYFEEIPLGHSVSIPPAPVSQAEMLEFAGNYDFRPLHTDEAYAKTTPFGGLIASGYLSFLAVWAKYLQVDLYGAELLAGKSSRIEWLQPVYAGDVLTGEATVTKKTLRSEKNGIVELTLHIYNQQGTPVLTNVTEAVVKCRDYVPEN